MPPSPFANRFYRGPRSDHFDGARFFNPGGLQPAGISAILRWRLEGQPSPWPDRFDSPFPQDRPPERVAGEELRLTFIGHASVLLQTAGLNILLDPVWSERCSPFSFAGPVRRNPPGIDFAELPPIDVVCVSHSHYDHLDRRTIERLADRHRPRFVVPLGVNTILRGWRKSIDVEAVDWLEEVALVEGLRLTVEPTHHWSARSLFDRRKTLWASFAFKTPAGLFYYVGDTGFFEGRNFAAARERHGPARLAILPIGAYEPRSVMAPQHQNPDEAVRAARILEAEMAIGSHWGTFRLTDEAAGDPERRLSEALARWSHPPERFVAGRPGMVWRLPQTIDAAPTEPLSAATAIPVPQRDETFMKASFPERRSPPRTAPAQSGAKETSEMSGRPDRRGGKPS